MRLINRVLAALLSLALIISGALLIIEVTAYRIGNRPVLVHWPRAYTWSRHTTWNEGSIRVTCVILILLGLVLLIAELKPARVTRLAADPAQAGATGVDTAYTRRGVSAAVRTAVTGVDGIRGAAVKVKRRRVTVKATAAAKDRGAAQGLREPVRTAVEERLGSLGLRRSPRAGSAADRRGR